MANKILKARKPRGQKQTKVSPEPAAAAPDGKPGTGSKSKSKAKSPSAPPPQFKPFPLDVLPKVLRDMAVEGSEAIGCDPSSIVVPGLAIAAGLVNSARFIEIVPGDPGWKEPCVVWGVTVGGPSSYKSPAWRLVNHPVTQISEEMTLRATLHQPARQIFATDLTADGLKQPLQESRRGLLYSRDEVHGWFVSMRRYDSDETAEWLEFFNAGTIVQFRKMEPKRIEIRGACVSVAGTITPANLAAAMRGNGSENGLIFRILITHPPKRLSEFVPGRSVSVATTDRWKESCRRLVHLIGEQVVLKICPEGLDLFVKFVNACRHRQYHDDEAVGSAVGKLCGYAARLALLHFLLNSDEADDGRGVVGVADMRAGITMASWFIGEAERALAMRGQTAEQREAQQLVDKIAARPERRITARELQRSNGKRYRTEDLAKDALRLLVEDGYLKVVKEGRQNFFCCVDDAAASTEEASEQPADTPLLFESPEEPPVDVPTLTIAPEPEDLPTLVPLWNDTPLSAIEPTFPSNLGDTLARSGIKTVGQLRALGKPGEELVLPMMRDFRLAAVIGGQYEAGRKAIVAFLRRQQPGQNVCACCTALATERPDLEWHSKSLCYPCAMTRVEGSTPKRKVAQ
jgi:hypothetical protein